MSLEKTGLTLGFIALADCAPLAAAKALGYFEEEGLSVALNCEPSWANIRDKVSVGALDGAHMLGPLTLASTMGLGGGGEAPMIAAMSLNLNGSAITISRKLAEALRALDPEAMAQRPRTAEPLKRLIEQRKAAGEPPLTFAAVFPYSVHNYELRYWLAEGGVDPDEDVRIVIVPPARLIERLAAGEIDGFCVTAPWNAVALLSGLGEVIVHACEIWTRSPDKVLGVTEDWAARHPQTLSALIRATAKGAAWADEPANRPELARILADPAVVGTSETVMRLFLLGGTPELQVFDDPDYIVFHRDGANRPSHGQAHWFLEHMIRWGHAPGDVDANATAARAYRPDLYEAAFKA